MSVMELNEVTISRAIIDDFSRTFLDYTDIDVKHKIKAGYGLP